MARAPTMEQEQQAKVFEATQSWRVVNAKLELLDGVVIALPRPRDSPSDQLNRRSSAEAVVAGFASSPAAVRRGR
jgi:hypothetical protein